VVISGEGIDGTLSPRDVLALKAISNTAWLSSTGDDDGSLLTVFDAGKWIRIAVSDKRHQN
jgi:hypothetical protein